MDLKIFRKPQKDAMPILWYKIYNHTSLKNKFHECKSIELKMHDTDLSVTPFPAYPKMYYQFVHHHHEITQTSAAFFLMTNPVVSTYIMSHIES